MPLSVIRKGQGHPVNGPRRLVAVVIVRVGIIHAGLGLVVVTGLSLRTGAACNRSRHRMQLRSEVGIAPALLSKVCIIGKTGNNRRSWKIYFQGIMIYAHPFKEM